MNTTGLKLGSCTTKTPGNPSALPAHRFVRHGKCAVAAAAVSGDEFTPTYLKMRQKEQANYAGV